MCSEMKGISVVNTKKSQKKPRFLGKKEHLTSFFSSNGIVGLCLVLSVMMSSAQAATYYVDASRPNDNGDGLTWTSAKQTIQAAVDLTIDSDTVLVTNGTYNIGSRVTPGYALTNRLVITNSITVQSINGPEVTAIEGAGPLGNTAIRCTYIKNGVLSGFTLTNGYTRILGNFYVDCAGGGGYAPEGIISNCIIAGNAAAVMGGGIRHGTLNNCIIYANSAADGGGVSGATLTHCTLINNSAGSGGGAYYGTLNNCIISNNSANFGGGVRAATIYNCLVTDNTAIRDGGGAYESTINNSLILNNNADLGGGVYYGTINNCTVVDNTAHSGGGGCFQAIANNCIILDNYWSKGIDNCAGSTLNYSCTTPLPASGDSNIDADPKFVDNACHIAGDSPCRGVGSSLYTTGTDSDSDAWANPPSIGYDEHVESSATGNLSVSIQATFTNAVVDTPLTFNSTVLGHALSNQWTFGDGTIQTNTLTTSHAWTNAGYFNLTFTAFNLDHPSGMTVTQSIEVVTLENHTHYVSTNSPAPAAPFTNWVTAAHTIQDAVDAATIPGSFVLVTNGLYNTGARTVPGYMLTNRVAVTMDIHLTSINGPEVTAIEGVGPLGYSAIRCIFITNGTLSGFTLQNGHTYQQSYFPDGYGGGCYAVGSVISNCIITTNFAHHNGGGIYGGTVYTCTISENYSVNRGGGAANSTLHNCYIINNTSGENGGGAHQSTLSQCTVFNNMAADYGGGIFMSTAKNCAIFHNTSSNRAGGTYQGTLNNCTIYGNTAIGLGGGSCKDLLNNCILWNNTSLSTIHSNFYQGTIFNSCSMSLPTNGTGNINADPLFIDPVNSNFHVQVLSPCIDAGQNDDDRMTTSTDLDNHSRIINGRVDMGAYEFHFDVTVQAMLQGPYSTNTHNMIAGLSNSIPLTSLYANDPRTVTNIPPDVIDWVLLQTRPSPSNTPTFSRSFFLQGDGSIMSSSGDTHLFIEVDPGSTNYLVVAHRNHPAVMSAEPIVFTNQAWSYDFTTSSNHYFGADSAAIELESGVWGLFAGDADGDGQITSIDQSICATQLSRTGYQCSDYDLDGRITSNDTILCIANADHSATFANAEIAFTPGLAISPTRETIITEDTSTLMASGSTNVITWFEVNTDSGGTISTINSSSTLYQAGTTSEQIDVIQAWDGDYRFGRSYLNVIDSSTVSSYGKAVVLAGRISPSDPLWSATDYLAGNAFNTLLYRGFSKDNVQYLSAVTNRDVDGDGFINDIDLYASVNNTAETFTNWVYDAEKLFVYFVDHGAVDGFGNAHLRLNPSETLSATTLDHWLDTFQDTQNKEVIVLVDCCYAARFMEELSYTGSAQRIVIATAGVSEPAYYMANGLISFSDAFFSGVMGGNDLATAYDSATSAMATYQQAAYYDNTDGHAADGLYLGATFVAGKDAPHIGMVAGNQSLITGTEATLWAGDVISAYALDRVWCVIVPPSHNPTNPAQAVIDIPELELAYNSDSGRYEGIYTGFDEPGSYKIMYYARDIWDSVSAPIQSYVVQYDYDERFIIVGGGETNWTNWESINNLANFVYNAMLRRGMNENDLYYMSASTNQDLDQDSDSDIRTDATISHLANAITNWAIGADALTIYLIGSESNDCYLINSSETLDSTTLDEWLDIVQLTNACTINVVMDFAASGAWIRNLTPSQNRRRICIASAKANREAMMDAFGMLSFTRFFMSNIQSGQSIGEAYRHAQYSTRRASGTHRQNARINDNGNGIPNEKNVDGILSKSVYMGPAFVTGNELPTIGSIPTDTEVTNATSLILWAANVSDISGITNVWCLVSPPSTGWHTNGHSINLLWNAGNGRYEGIFSDLTTTGTYTCTYFAQNTNGVISTPAQHIVQIKQSVDIEDDVYEPDNSSAEASVFTVGLSQSRTIHVSNDVDWVFFTAYTNFLYDIEIVHGTNQIDTVLTLYRREPNGLLTLIDEIDEYGYDQGEIMGLDHPALGLYYIKVHTTDFIEAGSYNLTITPTPSGGMSDKLIITVMNVLNGQPIPSGITAYLHTGSEQVLGTNDQTIFYGLADGDYTVTLNNVPDGWPHRTTASEINVHIPKQAQSVLNADFYLFPSFYMTGACRDGITMEWVGDADLAFTGMSHALKGQIMSHCLQSDGSFNSTQLYNAVDWELTVSKDGYNHETIFIPGASITPGTIMNLGERYLLPIDVNGNWIADSWEATHFGTGSNVNAQEDRDGDGYNNYMEYRLGTNPQDDMSALSMNEAVTSTNGVFTMRWPVAPGRNYTVLRTHVLNSADWTTVFGPKEATNQQQTMVWTDTNNGTNYFYRVNCKY